MSLFQCIYKEKADFFDSQSRETWANDAYTQQERAHIDRVLHMADIRRGCKVLEPGCGTGRLTEILCHSVGETGYVLALDISPDMIAVCLKRNAGFRQMDARCIAVEELDLEPSSFDAVVCHAVFPHFENPQTTLSVLSRTLKPSGHLIVSHFMGSAELNDMHRKAAPVQNDRLPEASQMRRLIESNNLTIRHFEDRPGCYVLDAVKG